MQSVVWRGNDLGSHFGADSHAPVIYTIVQTAELNGLNPEAYLNDVLTRIADGHPINRIAELMPWRISAAPSAPPL